MTYSAYKLNKQGDNIQLSCTPFSILINQLWKRPWCWERLEAGGEAGNRGWDDWMASLTQRTWVWANSRRWWRIVKPGVLQFTKCWTWLSHWTTTTTSHLFPPRMAHRGRWKLLHKGPFWEPVRVCLRATGFTLETSRIQGFPEAPASTPSFHLNVKTYCQWADEGFTISLRVKEILERRNLLKEKSFTWRGFWQRLNKASH